MSKSTINCIHILKKHKQPSKFVYANQSTFLYKKVSIIEIQSKGGTKIALTE